MTQPIDKTYTPQPGELFAVKYLGSGETFGPMALIDEDNGLSDDLKRAFHDPAKVVYFSGWANAVMSDDLERIEFVQLFGIAGHPLILDRMEE